jgi:hypothetical protein
MANTAMRNSTIRSWAPETGYAEMNAEEFVSLLDGVRPTSRGWGACCPAHDDSSPSLGIATGEDGRVLVHCFVSCSTQEICEALGLQVRDLFPSNRRGSGIREKQRRREHERIRKRQQRCLEGFQIDLLREAECVIEAACGIDISTWSLERLNGELARLARAYALLEKESRYGH